MLFSLSSFALSLLLVFRTNQAYARCVLLWPGPQLGGFWDRWRPDATGGLMPAVPPARRV